MPEIHYLSDKDGNPTAVIVPIELWREIESEEETAYLLKSENMKRRSLGAKDHQTGISLEEAREKAGNLILYYFKQSYELLLSPPAARLFPLFPGAS